MPTLIKPGPLQGTLAAIPSKADAHRKLICAALADAPTQLSPQPRGEDIQATINCLCNLGADIKAVDGGFMVCPITSIRDNPSLDCKESGSTLRFLLPLAALLAKDTRFCGEGRLPMRPLKHLIQALEQQGAAFSSHKLPLTVKGGLQGGLFTLPGDISSQYISGLLLALPLAHQDSSIQLTTPLQSAAYVNMTIQAQSRFGINIPPNLHIKGGQKYLSPGKLSIEGDWSNGGVFLAAGALGGQVCVKNLPKSSPQGDKAIVGLLQAFGAIVEQEDDRVTVSPHKLRGIDIDGSATPDLVPVLAVLGAAAQGRTRIYNISRLRLKESDRLLATAALLSRLGAKVLEGADYLSIEGQPSLTGGTVQAMGDHRMVMAAALAAIICKGEVIINDAACVQKSYPRFFEDYNSLGGKAYDVYLG